MPRPPLTPLQSAAEFITYYEQQLTRDPDSEEYGLALEMARWWQRLLRMPNPPREEINRLNLAMCAKRRDMGGRWFDLSGRIEKWKREWELNPRPQPTLQENHPDLSDEAEPDEALDE